MDCPVSSPMDPPTTHIHPVTRLRVVLPPCSWSWPTKHHLELSPEIIYGLYSTSDPQVSVLVLVWWLGSSSRVLWAGCTSTSVLVYVCTIQICVAKQQTILSTIFAHSHTHTHTQYTHTHTNTHTHTDWGVPEGSRAIHETCWQRMCCMACMYRLHYRNLFFINFVN